MADKKISALTAATTPLAGTEVLPIVQSSSTVKVSVANLTAGRAISATEVTASTGNFVVSTAGQGVDFTATAGPTNGTMTSELFADYEEGTFSLTANAATGSITLKSNTCYYTKIGRMVHCSGTIEVDSISSPTGNFGIAGFPYTCKNAVGADAAMAIYTYGWNATMTTTVMGIVSSNSTEGYFQKDNGAGSVAVLTGDVKAGTLIKFQVSYIV